ncbi:MAG TPA: carboxypeptidase regulatory-like domain-containing protein, partial [Candidatus Brocadiaceae bacterium]|nr:carboxypeptidase regulatory-like domain-containing protein [Candidatus Brocadiaceae bacterium]
ATNVDVVSHVWNWTVNAVVVNNSANITSWSNSNTSNSTLSFTVDKNTNVTFNISINQSVTTTWTGTASPTKINGTNENISYAYKNFTSAGTYTVIASCSNANGSCLNSVTWTITVNGTGNLTLSGYVKNTLELNLENARVDFNGSYVFTDATGHYSITGINEGTYATLARAIGYRNKTNTSTINADAVINFTLSEKTAVSAPGFDMGVFLISVASLYMFRKKKKDSAL